MKAMKKKSGHNLRPQSDRFPSKEGGSAMVFQFDRSYRLSAVPTHDLSSPIATRWKELLLYPVPVVLISVIRLSGTFGSTLVGRNVGFREF